MAKTSEAPVEAPSRFKPALQKSVSERALLPDGITSVPEEGQALNDECVRLHTLYLQARPAAFAGREALKRAPALDRAEDAEAHALGKPLGKRQHEAKARQALDACERRLMAATDSYLSTQLKWADSVSLARDSWLPVQADSVATVQDEIKRLLNQLSNAFDLLGDEQRVLQGLEDWPSGGRFSAGIAGFRRDLTTTVADKRLEERDKLERHAALKPYDSPDVGTLLAALGLKVDPAKPVPLRVKR